MVVAKNHPAAEQFASKDSKLAKRNRKGEGRPIGKLTFDAVI
jgi:hypothetical protein